jgi:hypothetical protein
MPSALVHGVRMTTLTLGISTSANYGDPECLANPRCADLFKDPKYWGSSDFYGIGGSEQVRLYLGTIRVGGKSHTLFVGLMQRDTLSSCASLRRPSGARCACRQAPPAARRAPPLTCVGCGREPRDDENRLDDWRSYSTWVELLTFCSECAEWEFGGG